MINFKHILAASAILGMCASCSNQDSINDVNSDGSVCFEASVQHPLTRAAGGETVAYSGPLTLWFGTVNGSVHADYTNSGGKWTATPPLYWENLTAGSDGIYPFYATANAATLNANATGGEVAADQRTDNGYALADLMAAYATATKRRQVLSFAFTHLMAQFTIVLNNSADPSVAFTADQLRQATVTATSLQTAYTASIGTQGSSVAKSSAATTLKDVILCPDAANATATTGLAFRCILPAQTVGSVIVNIGGNAYTVQVSHDIAAGENTVQALTLSRSGAQLGNVSLKDWVETDIGSTSLTADGIIIPQTVLSGITVAGTLFIATSDGKAHGMYPIDYANATASVNTSDITYEPLIWDDLTSGTSYTYNAYFCPSAQPEGNQRPDYLTCTTAATAWGTTPALELHHAMTKLIVKLNSDGTYTADELKKASITFQSEWETYNNSTMATVNLSKYADNPTNLGGEESFTVTMTNASAAADVTGTFSAIFCPQTLSGLTLTIAGKIFTLTKDMTLTAGQTYTLNATVKKTAIQMGSITVADWAVGTTADGTFQY